MQLFIMEDKKSMSFKIFLFFQKYFVVGEKIARYQVSSYTEYLVSTYTISVPVPDGTGPVHRH